MVERLSVRVRDGLNRKQYDHGMRRTTAVIRSETAEEPAWSFLLKDLRRTVQHASVRHLARHRIGLLGHEPTFDQIKRKRKQCGRETGSSRSPKTSRQRRSIRHGIVQQRRNNLLGLIVTGEHTDVHGHAPQDVRHESFV